MQNIYTNSAFINGAKDAIQEQFDAYNEAVSSLKPILDGDKGGKLAEVLSQSVEIGENLKNTAKSMIGHLNHFMKSGEFPTKAEMIQSIADIASTDADALDGLDEYKVLSEEDKLKFKFVCVNFEQISKFMDSALEVVSIAVKSISKALGK